MSTSLSFYDECFLKFALSDVRVMHLESPLSANHVTRITEVVARDIARHTRINSANNH